MTKLGFLLRISALVSFAVVVDCSSWGIKAPSTTSSPPVRKTASSSVVTGIPRGGGGIDLKNLIEPDLAAKIFIGAYGCNAALCGLAPKFAIKKVYGKTLTEAEAWIVTNCGAIGSNTALLLYLQHFNGMPFEKAIGWSVLPYLSMEIYRIFLSDEDKAVGFPKDEHYPGALLNAAVLGASFISESWVPKLNWFYGLFSLVHGVWFYLAPESSRTAMQVSASGPAANFFWRTQGYFLLSHFAAVCGGLHFGDILKATGWVAVASAVPLLATVVDGSFGSAGVPIPPALVWVSLMAVVGASLLMEAPAPIPVQ